MVSHCFLLSVYDFPAAFNIVFSKIFCFLKLLLTTSKLKMCHFCLQLFLHSHVVIQRTVFYRICSWKFGFSFICLHHCLSYFHTEKQIFPLALLSLSIPSSFYFSFSKISYIFIFFCAFSISPDLHEFWKVTSNDSAIQSSRSFHFIACRSFNPGDFKTCSVRIRGMALNWKRASLD